MKELLTTNLFYTLETIGIISFALSGIILATRKNFDPIGLYVVAFVTALGGGTIRDMILNTTPYWISHSEFPIIILCLALLFFYVKKVQIQESWLIIPDALGLALFSITGAQTAELFGFEPVIVIIIGTLSACFGGVLRDVLCGEIPLIFQKVSFYSVTSILGVSLYLILQILPMSQSVSALVSVFFIFIFRCLAYRFNWRFS